MGEIVHIVFLTMATVRFSQAAKRGQQYVRISYLSAVVVVVDLIHHAHCRLRCEATTLLTAVSVVPEGSWRLFSVSEYKTRRIRYVVTTF